MKLLIIKCGDDYIRIGGNNYSLCTMEKANVFPVTRLEEVKFHARKLKEKGFRGVSIYKLIIREEKYQK